jgi:hypothetical protein
MRTFCLKEAGRSAVNVASIVKVLDPGGKIEAFSVFFGGFPVKLLNAISLPSS